MLVSLIKQIMHFVKCCQFIDLSASFYKHGLFMRKSCLTALCACFLVYIFGMSNYFVKNRVAMDNKFYDGYKEEKLKIEF